MNILIGPLEPFQLEPLKKRFSPEHCIYPLFVPWLKRYTNTCGSRSLGYGALSKAFEEACSPEIDVVFNLESKVYVDWTKLNPRVLLGTPLHELKYTAEALAMASDYDLVFCKSERGVDLFRKWGIQCDRIQQLPTAELDPRLSEAAEDLPYLYDISFQGNLFNDNATYEYRDRHQALQALWKAQKADPSLKLFVHSRYMLTPSQSALAYKQSKAVFRDAALFQPSSTMHSEFILKTWQLRRPVLFWYARDGAQPRYHALRDGYNCVLYDETNIVAKLESILQNEALRQAIVENGYRSIDLLSDEIYTSFVNTIESHLGDVDNLLRLSNRRRNRLQGSTYYDLSTHTLSAGYGEHYFPPALSELADSVQLLGNAYVKTYAGLDAALSRFLDFLGKADLAESTPAIRLMHELSFFLGSITLTLLRLVDKQLTRETAQNAVTSLHNDFLKMIETYGNALSETPAEELLRAFHLFRPFSGVRDKRHFYEIDYLVSFHSTPANFLATILSFYERAFTEVCGDAAVLCGRIDLAVKYYARSVEYLRGELDSSRIELKLAMIGDDKPAIAIAARTALEHEPLNTFYTACVLEQPITGDPTHPGDGPSALDRLIFDKLVDRWTDSELKISLKKELALAGLFQAITAVFAPHYSRLQPYIHRPRLMRKVLFSSPARCYFREMLRWKAEGEREKGNKYPRLKVLIRLLAPRAWGYILAAARYVTGIGGSGKRGMKGAGVRSGNG